VIGDKVFVHAFGQLYIYEIKSIGNVKPSDISIFMHEDKPWLTLVTCASFDEKTGKYLSRLVVRAVLVGTMADIPVSGK
jgi:LPXTG-site transpeptidase (sortase) family protein